jgi:hypothetical protein
MLEHLRDDLATQLAVYAGDPDYQEPGMIAELDRPKIERLAEVLDFPFDWGAGSDQRRQAAKLLNRYGQRATIHILDQASAFTQSAGKTLLTILNYTARTDHYRGSVVPWDGMRRDQEILDHLVAGGVPLFGGDGHYNPRGNHFFAYALKDSLLELLDPKPLPYQGRGPETVDFSALPSGVVTAGQANQGASTPVEAKLSPTSVTAIVVPTVRVSSIGPISAPAPTLGWTR